MQKLLSYKCLGERGVSYSEEHLRRLAQVGEFPQPVKLSDAGRGSRKAWVESEIDAWIDERIVARDTGEAA